MRIWVKAALAGLVTVPAVHAETAFQRGAYLVNAAAACAGCHTPRIPPGPALSGGAKFGAPESSIYAPNITSDRATGIGSWTDRQIIDAIRLGLRPDGSRLGPPMPQSAYRAMSDADVQAIVAYLQSVTPISHAVPPSPRKPLAPTVGAMPVAQLMNPGKDPVSQGRYIATALSHCTECHTPVPLSAPGAAERIDEGGRLFRTPKGTIVAPGIRANDLARYTDGELVAIMTKGIRPAGGKIEGPMPVRSYAGLKPVDLDALIAFLRSDQSGKQP